MAYTDDGGILFTGKYPQTLRSHAGKIRNPSRMDKQEMAWE